MLAMAIGTTALSFAANAQTPDTEPGQTAVVKQYDKAQSGLALHQITLGGINVQVELAITPEEQERGLMHRDILPENHGMLFVFRPPNFICFWMKNTPLPLSIAFIDAQNRIVKLDDMDPFTEEAHCPPDDIAYALEMPRGWFTRHQITTGQTVTDLPR